ncbi:MAG: MerR family transcriptional regulator [Syntrophales bacterium]|nr:MerR family transcriptional regulator [Syntrophales bacterium]
MENNNIPDKEFFRIGEVSRIVGVQPHVIRYWESEFKLVKPVRTSSDQRLFRRKDVETLLMIKDLLYKEHFTIKGAKKELIKRIKEKENRANLLIRIKNELLIIREMLS